jgi:putative ABC transport system permease protein
MLDLEFLKGDPQNALEEPFSVVLTESLAYKYFANEDPIGKVLLNESRKQPYQVTGVIPDMPRNTHLKIEYMISISSFVKIMGFPEALTHRTWKAFYTYVLLRPDQTPESFAAKAPTFMKSFHADAPGRQEEILLQPIRKIHLHSKLEGEIGANSDIAYVYIFSGTALLLLLIAAVNFINLSTAQSFKRMKEIGIRKVLGASVPSITVLMSREFILWVIIANIIAWPAAYLAMNSWLANFAYRVHIHVWTFVFSAVLVILFALLTVSYQAIRAAVSNPVDSLRYE